ncbi:MAG: flagellar biosynthesis protein FlgJ [Rhodospirillaceae bacterium]|nr:flagellar biosynthesis protein FlgJ [Rhodospirillaceae bacterium]
MKIFLLSLAVAVMGVAAYGGWRISHEQNLTVGVGFVTASDLRVPSGIDSQAKKAAFFDFLRPVVQAENRRIERLRRRLIAARAGGHDPAWVGAVAKDYGLDWEDVGRDWELLLKRVDKVPLRLALAQSANESDWGRSRFAQQANNMFGQWCFTKGCGLVPKLRRTGGRHEVAAYETVNASVRAYLHNINTGWAYVELRSSRGRLRRRGLIPTAQDLAVGLTAYSERGAAYVRDIRTMIRTNKALMSP